MTGEAAGPAGDSAINRRPAGLEVPAAFPPPFWYDIYGLKVRSDVPLPMEPKGADRVDHADVAIGQAASDSPYILPSGDAVRSLRCSHGTIVAARHDDDQGTWLHFPAAGTFTISPAASQVAVRRARSGDESLFRLVLACQVLTFVLHRRGTPSLHASAVATEGGAVVFLGPKGRGKSTMAASFLQRGAALLTDDALPLRSCSDGVYGVPSLPLMKVWRETAERALAVVERLPPVAAKTEKRLLLLGDRFRLAKVPVRIRAIYVLDRVTPDTGPTRATAAIETRRLSAHESIAILFGQTSMIDLLFPSETPELLRMYSRLLAQAPIRLLRYQGSYDHQEVVHDAIMADLATH